MSVRNKASGWELGNSCAFPEVFVSLYASRKARTVFADACMRSKTPEFCENRNKMSWLGIWLETIYALTGILQSWEIDRHQVIQRSVDVVVDAVLARSWLHRAVGLRRDRDCSGRQKARRN